MLLAFLVFLTVQVLADAGPLIPLDGAVRDGMRDLAATPGLSWLDGPMHALADLGGPLQAGSVLLVGALATGWIAHRRAMAAEAGHDRPAPSATAGGSATTGRGVPPASARPRHDGTEPGHHQTADTTACARPRDGVSARGDGGPDAAAHPARSGRDAASSAVSPHGSGRPNAPDPASPRRTADATPSSPTPAALTRLYVAVAVAVGAVSAIVIGGKILIARPGPGEHEIASGEWGFFPSGHTATSAICFGAAALLLGTVLGPRARRRVHAGAAVLCALVGFALLWCDYHWLGDVLASWTLCGLALWAAARFTPGDRPSAETFDPENGGTGSTRGTV
ncbi:MAG: phosphatase PAP2 family protein [Streptomycetaceae bacterium]|nr:phosphatase PAP2 family protein [Streptomycetaceae bacterium]